MSLTTECSQHYCLLDSLGIINIQGEWYQECGLNNTTKCRIQNHFKSLLIQQAIKEHDPADSLSKITEKCLSSFHWNTTCTVIFCQTFLIDCLHYNN